MHLQGQKRLVQHPSKQLKLVDLRRASGGVPKPLQVLHWGVLSRWRA